MLRKILISISAVPSDPLSPIISNLFEEVLNLIPIPFPYSGAPVAESVNNISLEIDEPFGPFNRILFVEPVLSPISKLQFGLDVSIPTF